VVTRLRFPSECARESRLTFRSIEVERGTPEQFRDGIVFSFCYDPTIEEITAVHRRDAVKVLRFSIAKVMVIVGVVALNLAAVQFWSPSSEPSLFTGRVLMSIALQVGLFCLIRSQRIEYRIFWWGFLSFGLAAFITSVFIDLSYTLPIDFSPIDSCLFNAMDQYLAFSYDLLARLCMFVPDPYLRSRLRTVFLLSDNTFTCHFVYDFVSFLPQLFIALSGGVLTSVIIRRWNNRHDPVALGSATI
jgi:hypothetical protein